MSKVLESLVARGRRVRNFRESREITYGLADLSTNHAVHERLVKKGGVETLVNILITAQDAEAQQFAALAVANTASTKSLCNDIIKLDGVVEGLVKYIGNEEGDSIGRQYTAMALGNILAEPITHATLVEAGCIVAIVTMLKNCCDARELESGKYAAFALANIAFDRQYQEQIVESGAVELLVALACCEDPDTQRHALAAVRGLCTTTENRLLVLQKGILDPLILMSRSSDIDIVREVSSALNCLSSEDENKEEISYRAISTLINMSMSSDGEIEHHACCAIANLMEVTDIHSRFLEESGIPPLIALCSSVDGPCRMEATRAVANLSSNPDFIEILIQEKALGPLVKSLEQDGDNCRFSALAIANFATHAPSLFKIVQAGALPHLVSFVSGPDNNVEGRRYGALALANMTACEAFHAIILKEEGPEALFSLSNSCDTLSNVNIACALANLSSNTANHESIVEMGGLQPTIALAYDTDVNVHKQAAAALRGFSATGNIKMKIVQEGGLEPLCRLLLSEDDEVLRETTACLCNLSLGDENKFEITKSGAVLPLINLTQSEDLAIAHYACECLANLAEMTDNQDFIAREGAVVPCITAMRSRHIEVQRESGRLLANLAASISKIAADVIVDGGGHDLLISFLLSQDTNCQRVAAFGIGNLSTHEHHRRTLARAGVLEPLTSLARSGKIELQIRRFSMLAIANLAACFENHDEFVSQETIPMLVSFSNSADPEIRNYAAFAIAELSKNSDMMEIITDEGGLEPVLYLARSDDKKVQRQILPSLTTLSFLDCNKEPICTNGALSPIVNSISERSNSADESQMACCAVANLAEVASNMALVVNHGCVPLLIGALDSNTESVQREAARAVGNLAVNMDYCDLVIKHGATTRLVTCFQSRNCDCQRAATMALANLSSNLKSHAELLKHGILDLVKMECLASIDPKRFSDHETVRSCILIISNLTGGVQNHSCLDSFFGILMDFTRHRDIVCRQHAILALGNLCSNPLLMKELLEVKCTDALVAFAFPPTSEDSINAQFQAIAGLRGMSKHAHLRVPLLRGGGLEPLIIGAQGNNRFSCTEIQREAAATLSNLALEESNRILIAKSGALPALVNLVKKQDALCQVHAETALANLAESSGEVHELLLSEECLEPMCRLIKEDSSHIDVQRAASRCISLFASNKDTHTHLLQTSVVDSIKRLATSTSDTYCERFSALAVANLALVKANHKDLLLARCVESLLPLVDSDDIETLRGISFALHSFSKNEENHARLENTKTIESLVTLARCGDRDTALQACLAVKYLCVCEACRNKFVENGGLEPLLALAARDDLETKREVTAALRNVSLSDMNKKAIMVEDDGEGNLDIIALLCRDADHEVAHQAVGVVANISERQENKITMVKQGIVHHLQYSMLSKSTPVLRESIRSFANLSSAEENTICIVSSGALTHLIAALESSDTLCRRFAAMTMSNIASNDEGKVRIIREGGVLPLMIMVRQMDNDHTDRLSQEHAMSSLANLAACPEMHVDLLERGCAELSMSYLKSSDLDLRSNALLCVSNFASNSETHAALEKCSINEIIKNLECNDRTVQLRAVTSLRGLSTNPSYRKRIISEGGVEPLLTFVHLDDAQLKTEVLSTLCNLSLGGFMGDRANALLQKVDMQSLITFLCNSDSTQRLFGAVAIGNIASHLDLQAPVFDSGALQPLIGLTDTDAADVESQRCMAYAICNLTTEIPNRSSIILMGGLPSIMFLCHTGDTDDMLAALSTLRGLAASADARRPIVEEGVFSVLSLATKSDCLKCKREVAGILVLLSLNEENKTDLVRSDEMSGFVALTDLQDAQCVSQICKAIGNVSEVMELHSDLLQIFTVDRLVRLSSFSDELVLREVSRCCANVASNFDNHVSLVKPQMLQNLSKLCLNVDVDIRRFSVLALANICLNADTHTELSGKDLVSSVLYNVINDELPSKIPMDKSDLQRLRLIESKCFACVSLSTLCQGQSFVQHIIEVGMVPALLKLLQEESQEMNLHVAFVLNKLSMSSSTAEELSRQKAATVLTMHTHGSNKHALTYSIATLRRLSDDENIRVEMIASNAVDFMAKFCDLKNTERCREIASGICNLALWDEARIHILGNEMFGHILDLARSSDVETSRFALGALANIADDSRYYDAVANKSGVVNSLVSLVQNDSIPVKREAARALSNVLSSMAAQSTFLNNKDGMKSLVGVSQLEDYDCAYNASVAFVKLAANVRSHDVLFTSDGFGSIINLTSREEKSIRVQSAGALRDISSNQDFKLPFAEKGGIRTAIELASRPDVDLKIIAFGIIRHLAISMELKRTLVDSGIVGIMADCIVKVDNSLMNGDNEVARLACGVVANMAEREENKIQDLLYQCASSIANMAEHGQNKIALVHMGAPKCLVSLSNHESVQVKREAARAFSLISSAPENNVGVFDKKTLSAVIDLLRCQDEETGRDSAGTISNLLQSLDVETARVIGNLDSLPPLIELLSSPYESCKISACKALCRLTTLEENKIAVCCHGGLRSLIELCDSSNLDVSMLATMVLCNLSTCPEYQMKFVEENGIPTLKVLLASDSPVSRKNTIMILCNLTSNTDVQDHVAMRVDLLQLLELMNDDSLECSAFAVMTICNLASKRKHGVAILDSGGLQQLASMVTTTDGASLQRAALLTLYNLSTFEESHQLFVENKVLPSIVTSCQSPDVLCQRFAILILSNLACNDATRSEATRGGGLQAAVLSLAADDFSSRRFACICLANMGNDTTTQSQIVVHGGLPSLVSLCLVDDDEAQVCAFKCLSNLAANESNHSPMMKQGVFKAFVQTASIKCDSSGLCSTFGIANLTSNSELLSQIGRGGGIKPLIALAKKSEDLHSQCLALSSLRRLAFVRENRSRLMAEGIVETLINACKTDNVEILREIASAFCNLTLSPNHRLDITKNALSEIAVLTQRGDTETVRLSLGAQGNLAEDIETHSFFIPFLSRVVACLEREDLGLKREAARVLANLLSSCEIHPQIIQRGLDSLILLSANSCEECRYLTAMAFCKLGPTIESHKTLINDGLANIVSLVVKTQKHDDMIRLTRKHSAIVLRDLSASGMKNILFSKLGVHNAMLELIKDNDKDIQIIAVATLRHLSVNDWITADFSESGITQSVIRCISWANEDMRCQIAGLFANLSEHRECQSTIVSNGIVKAIDALLSIENDEVWQDSSRTLANLCANEGLQAKLHRQGALQTLAKLGKSKGEVSQRYVAIAIRFMSSSVEVQKSLANGHESFPFLEFSASNLLDFQRAAAAAFASMSLNETGKSLVLRKGGVKPVLQLCIHLDLAVRRDAVFCVANFAGSPDFCQFVVKEGGVETIKAAATTNQDVEILRDSARAMSSFSVDTATKEIMISQEVPKVLCKLAKSPDSATQRFASLALCNLCMGTREQKELVVKQGVLRVLLFLLRFPDLEVERCASLAITALTLGSNRNKTEVVDNGFVRPLIETTTYPDTRMKQCALLALNGIALGELPETKDCVFREDGLPQLLELVKSDDDECIHAGLYILGTLAERVEIRDAIVATDCLQLVVDKTSVGSIEIKRAASYFLSLLVEGPQYHDGLRRVGGLESAVALASLVDEECQDYGAFTLAFLANNKTFQVPLVKMGGVRPLVAMMATHSESKHYASLALLKLSDNFENHATIAEEGGIQALLTLGRSKISSETIKYQSSIQIGKMAKAAAAIM